MSKGQLKKKLSEVTHKPQINIPKRNRNGKQGISKANGYKFIPDAPRKSCFCGNSNHLAIDCKKSKKKKTAIPKSDVRSRSVFYKSQNPYFHCGSSWQSIYTCSSYHELYHIFYDPLPKFNKAIHVDNNTRIVEHNSVRANPDKVEIVRKTLDTQKLKLSKVRTQQVWVLKNPSN